MVSLDVERRYLVDGRLLPFTLAKKFTRYPEWCVSAWHDEDRVQQPALRDSNLCPVCTDSLRSAWAEMAAAYVPLQDRVAPSQSFGNGDRVGGGPVHPPLPIDVTVSDLLRDIRDEVASVVRDLVEDRPDWKRPADPTTDVLADNLARWHVDYIATHPRAGHARAVLENAWSLSQRIARTAVYDGGRVEAPMNERCRHRENVVVKVGGKPRVLSVQCEGMVVAVQSPAGARAVVCDLVPAHAIPADIWMQMMKASLPRPSRTVNTLARRYADGLA